MWLLDFVARGDYNEPEIIRQYVRHNCAHLMTPFETMAVGALTSRNKHLIASLKPMLGDRYKHEDSAVVKSLDYGHEQFMEAVVDRILRDRRDAIDLCRCPQCNRVAATPKAHQCLWCKADWHQDHA